MSGQLSTPHWVWAHRVLLGAINRDADAAQLLAAEIGDCPDCWRLVAGYTAVLADLHTRPSDREATVNSLLGSIQFALDTDEDEVLTLGDPDDEGEAA
jgi:hypothetical protein